MGRIAEGLYYGIQKVRCGLSRSMVRRATELLERPWPQIRRYVDERIAACHRGGEADGLRWLERQPVTERAAYQVELEADPIRSLRVERRRTSGSTGSPFSFLRDPEMLAWMDAAMWAAYSWHGVRPGHRMARFWGRPLSRAGAIRRRVLDYVLGQRRMTAFDVSLERSREFYEELFRWKPEWVYGYPTLIREFVEHLRRIGRDGAPLGVRVVITTGEILSDSTRRALGEFFDCPVVNEYGCSETGVLAFECERGSSHAIPVAAYPEVLGAGSRSATDGPGRVVATDLYGTSMPFRRYALEDLAVMSGAGVCSCGRELPLLDVVSGREDGFIRTPDGRQVYDAVLAYSVPAGVSQFQVAQTDAHRLQGRIVVGAGQRPEEVAERCRQRWQDALPADLRIEVEVVDEIPCSESGKRRYFVPLQEATD